MTITRFTFDVETSIEDGNPSATRDGTRLVVGAYRLDKSPVISATAAALVSAFLEAPTPLLICGFNLSFDLLHLIKAGGPAVRDKLLRPDVRLFDAQIVHYLLSGCADTFPTLETACAAHSVPFNKDNWATDSFKRGIGADVLQMEDAARLERYVVDDVRATAELVDHLVLKVQGGDNGMRIVVQTQNRVLLLATLMENVGMPVDLGILEAMRKDNQAHADGIATGLNAALATTVPPELLPHFNPDSNKQLGALLYGGSLSYATREPIGVYKTGPKVGQTRYRVHEHTIELPGLVADPNRGTDDAGSVDKQTLAFLLAQLESSDAAAQLLAPLLENRKYGKLDSTYYGPIAQAVRTAVDGRLHGHFNMAATNTGRKSSSEPNLQNIPNGVRAAIKAADDYVIVAADFKQLELVGLAYLSGCPKLRSALLAGADIHAQIKAIADKQTGRDIDRTNVKRVVFGRIYGGGAKKLSAQSGIPLDVVKLIIKIFDAMFPAAAAFYKRVEAALKTTQRANPGQPYYNYMLPSGRLLRFTLTDEGEFPYTEMKNRPVQSFATADIVPFAEVAFLQLWQALPPDIRTQINPIASVHDELVLDSAEAVIPDVIRLFTRLEARLPELLTRWYTLPIPFDLPLKIELGIGDSWLTAKKGAKPLISYA